MSDEAQSHSPFLRRIREGGRRDDRVEEQASVEPPPPGLSGVEPSEPSEEEARSARDGLRHALLEVGERVDEIITGAEQAAEEVRRRARADADRYLADRRRRADALEAERNRRFQEALEALRSGVARIEGESEHVARSVEQAISRTEEAEQAAGAPPDDAPAPAQVTPAPVAYPGRASREPDGAEGSEQRVSMLIRATQLAVQGHERAEIEQTLQNEFGGADAELVVDQVLGRR